MPTDLGVPSPGERPPRWYVAANAALDAWEIGHRHEAMYAAMGELREACREFAALAARGDSPAREPDTEGFASCCHAGRDGDCSWSHCPQERDGRADYRHLCSLALIPAGAMQESLASRRAALPSGDATTPPDLERDAELLWRFWVRHEGGNAQYARTLINADSIPWSSVRTKPTWREIAACEREALASRTPREDPNDQR